MGRYIFYGHEDYQTIGLYSRNFELTNYYTYVSIKYHYGNNNTFIYPIDHSYLDNFGSFHIDIEEHPEILNTAKKLYIHPDCSLSREIVRKKYKRCLNIASADAIIIPKENAVDDTEQYTAIFSNDDTKTIVFVTFYYHDTDDQNTYTNMAKAPLGTPMEKFIPPKNMKLFDDQECIKNTNLIYVGPTVFFKGKGNHVLDYMTFMLPKDKIVFEDTLMKALGDETNIPTFDSMISIHEMLNSREVSVIDLGLKTLAAMDYSNYPKSTTYILKRSNWNLSNVRQATAVKYMLKELGIRNTSYSSYISYKDRIISEQDYALFEQLVRKIEKLENNVDYVHYCYGIPFVYIDDQFKVHPRVI